jgi:ubiquinone/menaquinone biosynthesis C-methylase UbiE
MRRIITIAVALAMLDAVRRGLVVRAIRAVDQRGNLFAPRGARLYAALSPRVTRGIHGRVVADVVELLGSDATATVVDVGAGPGDLVRGLAARLPAAHVVGVEPSDAMRAVAAERGNSVLAGSAGALPFPDASVDLVVSTLSAHHWPDPAAALRELDRVLRPGGEARIYDVRFAAYSPAELGRFASAAGLEPGRISRTVLPGRLVRPFVLVRLAA